MKRKGSNQSGQSAVNLQVEEISVSSGSSMRVKKQAKQVASDSDDFEMNAEDLPSDEDKPMP
jgi:hypothetical protein